MRGFLRAVAGLALAVPVLLASPAGFTHEGHDHGPPPPPLPTAASPRVAAHTNLYELVAVANGETLTIFLDRYDSNEPVTDARVEVLAGAATIAAEPRSDGSYRASVPGIARTGRHDLVFNIAHRRGDDLLAGTLEIGSGEVAATARAGERGGTPLAWLWQLALIGAGLAVGFMLGRLRSSAIAPVLAALVAVGLARADPAAAHEGHELSPAPAGDSLSGDMPRRLPDGSVFLPKPTQRLISVRTQAARLGEERRAIAIVGHVISDPNRSGIVQSISGGRIVPPTDGLPRLGQEVRAGHVMATVVPALPLADQSTLAERQRELEGALSLAQQRRERLGQLSSSASPRSRVEDIDVEIDSLRRRLATLAEVKVAPEVLTAPVDGIVSAGRVVAGQVVQAQDVLFQIVDPASLWVEALLFDQSVSVEGASALTPDGTVVQLAFKGRGRAMQQLSTQLHLAIIEPPAGISIGLPVTVLVRTAQSVKGMLLPRDAVVRDAGGQMIVWHHLDPERFVPRPVRVEAFDGRQLLVTAGIADGDRVVVHGAELVSQVR